MSGHKSAASLNIYQRVDDQEKTKLGITLGTSLTTDEINRVIIKQQVEEQYQKLRIGAKRVNQSSV